MAKATAACALSRREMASVLDYALDLIRDPRTFTRREFARDWAGRSVPPDHPFAAKFCARGAISEALRRLGYRRYSPGDDSEIQVTLALATAVGMCVKDTYIAPFDWREPRTWLGRAYIDEAGQVAVWNNITPHCEIVQLFEYAAVAIRQTPQV